MGVRSDCLWVASQMTAWIRTITVFADSQHQTDLHGIRVPTAGTRSARWRAGPSSGPVPGNIGCAQHEGQGETPKISKLSRIAWKAIDGLPCEREASQKDGNSTTRYRTATPAPRNYHSAKLSTTLRWTRNPHPFTQEFRSSAGSIRAEGRAIKLPVQFGDHLADCFRSACGWWWEWVGMSE